MKKQRIGLVLLIVMVLSVTVGYAVFSETTSVSGIVTSRGRMIIEFDSVGVPTCEGYTKQCTASNVARIETTGSQAKKIVEITVQSLEYPGAFVEIPITIKNNGDIPVILESIDTSGLVSDKLIVSYTGVDAEDKTPLLPNATKVVTVKVLWDFDNRTSSASTPADFTIDLNYRQITIEDSELPEGGGAGEIEDPGENPSEPEEPEEPPANLALTTKNYTGYYGDVNGDGTPDGVIFVDLLKSANNNQTTVSGMWNTYSSYKNDDTYSYTTLQSSKEYVISEESYTGSFGTYPIISIKKGSTGNDRFYVMALNDISSTEYYWNKNYSTNKYVMAEGILESTSTTQVGLYDSNGKSIGKRNTEILMQVQTLTSDANNLWHQIGGQTSNGWFVPSRAEWSAFGDAIYTKIPGTKCTKYNYKSTFNISDWYWSSSQKTYSSNWGVNFIEGHIHTISHSNKRMVRLATTF